MITWSQYAPRGASWTRYPGHAKATRDALYCYNESDDASLVVEGIGKQVWFQNDGTGKRVVAMYASHLDYDAPACECACACGCVKLVPSEEAAKCEEKCGACRAAHR